MSHFPFDMKMHDHPDGPRCLACLLPMTGSEGVNTNQAPSPGSIALCWECGHVQAFDNPPIRYRELTDQEVVEIAGWPIVVLANQMRGVSKEREAMLKAKTLTLFKDLQLARRAAALVRKMRKALEADAKERK